MDMCGRLMLVYAKNVTHFYKPLYLREPMEIEFKEEDYRFLSMMCKNLKEYEWWLSNEPLKETLARSTIQWKI